MSFLEELCSYAQKMADEVADHLKTHQQAHRMQRPGSQRHDGNLHEHQPAEAECQNAQQFGIARLQSLIHGELDIERSGEDSDLQGRRQREDLRDCRPESIDPRPQIREPRARARLQRFHPRGRQDVQHNACEMLGEVGRIELATP